MDEARLHMATAAKVLVVGTSLTVHPAASLVKASRGRAEKVLVSLEMERIPYGFKFLRGNATSIIPSLINEWLTRREAGSNNSFKADASGAA